jgi:predicted ATPase/class 3 adenylate cyclase
MHYCGMCGTRLAQMCLACGFANPVAYRYCGMCGARLVEDIGIVVEAERPAALLPGHLDVATSLPLSADELPIPMNPTTIQLDGERRVVTVVMTDMTSSTNLLDKLGTEAWVELMNRVFHILEAEIYRFGGEVSQFRGDGLIALFGATEVHEDDPERAVLAALSMQKALTRFAGDPTRREELDLRMRVGVNTGEVIITSIGDRSQHREETAMGIAVAIAARMEAASEPGTVLVSEYTHRLVAAQFEWQPLGEAMVRGVIQPIAVYRPVTVKTESDRLTRSELIPDSLPLLGRESEFHAVKQSVENLFRGLGRVVMLTGDKGIGKTFLVNAVHEYLVHRGALLAEAPAGEASGAHSLNWLRGRCRSYHQTWPYSLWIELLHSWLGTGQIESKEETRDRLRLEAQALWGESFVEHYPYLATLLSLPLENEFVEKVRYLNGEGLRQRFFQAIRSWVQTMAKRGPLVMQCSDTQWADESSLRLLHYCLPVCYDAAMLWLIVFRSERATPMWKFRQDVETEFPHRLTTIDLPPLTESQSQQLVESLVGLQSLPQETLSLIVKNAEGNPYYIVELIQSLFAGGVLTRKENQGQWYMTRTVTTLDVPDSLQTLLRTRINRLSPDERFVLEVAAVIGPVFWFPVLEYLTGEMHSLKSNLAALQWAQLIEESGRVSELGMQYRFRSSLIRDAAYESLLSAQRAAYHLRAAEYLEQRLNPDALVDYYSLLAHHFCGADNPRKELIYSLLAAKQARKIYGNAEALQHYTRALELADRLEAEPSADRPKYGLYAQRFEILEGRRELLYQMGQLDGARADSRALLPLAEKMPDDPIWQIDAWLAQPELKDWESREELNEGLRLAQQALALARQAGNRRGEMDSLSAVARLSQFLHDPAGRQLAEQALMLARELGDLPTEVNLLFDMAQAYGPDDAPSSQKYLEAALAKSESLSDKATEITLLRELGVQHERRGDYYRQLTEYEQKRLRIGREIGNRLVEGDALMRCGQIQGLYLGDYDGGLALIREALQVGEHLSSRLFILLRLAQIQIWRGHHDEAQAALELARPLSEQTADDVGRAGFGLVTAILSNALGDKSRLRQGLEMTAGIRQLVANNLISRQYQMAAASEAAAAHLGLARGWAGNEFERESHVREALGSSQTAVNLYQEFGFVQIVECTSEELFFRHSQALAINDHAAEAADYLGRAHDEMMRKHALIPMDSSFGTTYLENIAVHRELRAMVEAQPGK